MGTRKSNNLARQRGARFEYRVAKGLSDLQAYVYKGQSGDVVAGDFIVECKYRMGYHGLGEFASFLEQAQRNAEWWKKQGQPKDWLLITTGGRRSGVQVTMDEKVFLALWRKAHGNVE